MTDDAKFVIDTLYKEFQRINSKSVTTDDWFFHFLSIAVVPFLVFLAYCLANPPYRIFVATLPFLSLIGLAVVVVLSTHYLYAEAYGKYLIRRINYEFGAKEIREVEFGSACYKGWYSPVTVSYVIGIGMLVLLNIIAIPVISSIVKGFLAAEHRLQLGKASYILENYWPITGFCVIVTVVALLVSAFRVQALTRSLLEVQPVKRVPPDPKHNEERGNPAAQTRG